MQTLVFNGSPRQGGDTQALIDALLRAVRRNIESAQLVFSPGAASLSARRGPATPSPRLLAPDENPSLFPLTISGPCSKDLPGDVKMISCADSIAPCNDCRYCRAHPGCVIPDAMQDVYAYLTDCDVVVLASPIWFSSLSGPLLNLASRLQTLFCARHFRGEPVDLRAKDGVLILAGAQAGTETMPEKVALTLLKLMNVDRAGVKRLYALDTDRIPAWEDAAAIARAREIAARLRSRYGG